MGWTSGYVLENEHGERYDLTAPAPVFLVDVTGLGVVTERDYGEVGRNFFVITEDATYSNPIQGDLIYQPGAFNSYQKLVNFIAQAKELYFCYAPLDEEYRCRVKLDYINKDRRDKAGWMRAPISFNPLTPWFLPEAAVVEIDTGGPDSKAYLYHSGSSTKTASGAIVSFNDGANAPVVNLTVSIEPAQSGSGDPSPDNVRPISGWTGANIHVSPTTDAQDGTTYSITFPSEAGTVYGGTLDVTTGTLTVTHDSDALTGSENIAESSTNGFMMIGDAFNEFMYKYAIPSAQPYPIPICSHYKGVAYQLSSGLPVGACDCFTGAQGHTIGFKTSFDTTQEFAEYLAAQNANGTPVRFVLPLRTPRTYQLTPQEVTTLLGTNNIWADCGDSTVEYQTGANYYYTYNDALVYGPEVSGDLTKRIYPAGHEPSGLLIRYTGAIENPVISLVGTSGRVYGECHINETFAAGETIELCTAPDNSYIHKISGGVVTDLMAASKVDLAYEPYPRAPVDETSVLRITGDDPVTGKADLTIYRYFRSV